MTTPTRLAEIADRGLAATVVPERYLMAAPPFQPTPDPCAHQRDELAYLRAQLTAAQARSREDAEIMRRAASGVESHNMVEWPGESGVSLRCNICGAPDDIELGPKHTEQCFITKLRARADELEGRT